MIRKHPAIFILVSIIFGIIIGDLTDYGSWLFLSAAVVCFIISLSIYYKDKRWLAGILFILVIMFISSFNYSYRQKSVPPGHILHYCDDNQAYTIYGTIDEWPVIRENQTTVILTVDSLGLDQKIRPGKGRLQLNIGVETTSFGYGDRIYFTSRLYSLKGGPNLNQFDYHKFMNLKGVFAVAYITHHHYLNIDRSGHGNFHRIIENARSFIRESFQDNLQPSSAALANGFLIGETRDIPVDIYNKFLETGTLHLLAVSGSNVALVVIVFAFVFGALPITRSSRTVMLLILVVVFSYLAYNQPSVVRASIMAALALIGRGLERRVDFNNIIAATAVIILIVDPRQLYDVGFQLSFTTAWGLIFLTPIIAGKLKLIRLHPALKYSAFLLITCAIAQIVSFPLTYYYFQRLPLIAFVSNLLIVPAVSIAVIGEVILLLMNIILPFLGLIAGLLLNPIIESILWLLDLFNSARFSITVSSRPDLYLVFGYYVALAMAGLAINSMKLRRLLVYFILVVTNIFLITVLFERDDRPEFVISSTASGLIVYSEFQQNSLIISDFVERNYSISNKIILPYLKLQKADSLNIISLSNDFATINEAITIADSLENSRLYLSATGKNLYNDIRIRQPNYQDNIRPYFYNNISKDTKDDLFTGDYYGIVNGAFFCNIDSSQILIISDRFDWPAYLESKRLKFSQLTLVKPSLSKADLRLFQENSHTTPIIVITGFLTSSAEDYYQENYELLQKKINLVEMSQVGVVRLVSSSGQLAVEY